jgi:hypothetical protein
MTAFNKSLTIVFIHGYSVGNLDTFGELPVRIRAEAKQRRVSITTDEIYLSRYISFNDAVLLDDVSVAFENAIREKLSAAQNKLMVITHSTGGPVVRNWWNMYYHNKPEECPMTHLIMLAPANYGSALAQLGKGKLSRIKCWTEGVESGQGILNWLELGSEEAWKLNERWILEAENQIGEKGVFPFVITGQAIDRKFYDNLNSYTGELGTDGVVRNSLANLQGRMIQLSQKVPIPGHTASQIMTHELHLSFLKEAAPTAFRIVSGKSHSGSEMGIMASVKKELTDTNSEETIEALFSCFQVETKKDYIALVDQFERDTMKVQESEKIEANKSLLKNKTFIHDRFSTIIFQVKDTEGRPISDFDLILTAGENSDPNHLPDGFLADRQINSVHRNTITLYLNYDLMVGSEAIIDKHGKVVREKTEGAEMLGFQLNARPETGFVKYAPCEMKATKKMLEIAIRPNETTLIEISVQRLIDQEIFQLIPLGPEMPGKKEGEFKGIKPSGKSIS